MARQTPTAPPKSKFRPSRTCQRCKGTLVLTRDDSGRLVFICDDCG